ncbi:unnamed protein product [Cladocopium goreaui]|uniref:Indole-3-acetic acid-amido synthetase GH3.15 (Auxin-responsive GH3-like protein 15) (AtGH3-15) (Protein GRETCHEN HAGEN 3.15) n=1 Tax=Cladocopium goreaui TaxID=2562237 RepID=A0A9P1G6W6_9DINO|nr:unnamed protein product [Cladocopium goreaui]
MAWWHPAVGSAALATGLVLWQVQRREWSESHTWRSAVQQYMLYTPMRYLGELRLRQVLYDASRAEAVQKDLLQKLLKRHQETAYGAHAQLRSINSWEAYRRAQPITQYSDYTAHLHRIHRGEPDVLSPGPAPRLAMTSATAGEPKFLPEAMDLGQTFHRRGGLVALAVLHRYFPEATETLQRSLKLAFRAQKLQLDSGVVLGCKRAPDSPNFDRLLCAYSSPKAAYDIMHEPDAMYAHVLFALKDRDLGMLEANFASNICDFFDFLRDHSESLASDLEQGRIWSTEAPEKPVSKDLLVALSRALTSDGGAARAAALRSAVRGDGDFSARELWPKLRLVVTVTGGNFEAASCRLRRLLGDVPIYSPFYAATEGLLGVNIAPDQAEDSSMQATPSYLLDAGSMVMELLPLQWSQCPTGEIPREAPIPVWDGDVDHSYELILTTRGGLCRYRIGDVVRIAGKVGQMPLVELQGRAGKCFKLCGKDLPEFHFVRALARSPVAAKVRGAMVVETGADERLHICIEEDLGQVVTPGDLNDLHARLGAAEPFQLHRLQRGALEALRRRWLEEWTQQPPISWSQVKMPVVLKGHLAEELLKMDEPKVQS